MSFVIEQIKEGIDQLVADTVDRELIVTTYQASNAFTGASIGDTITMTQVIDVSGTPSTVSTIWRNQSTGADLAGAPTASDLTLVGSEAIAGLVGSLTETAPASDTASSALNGRMQRIAQNLTTVNNSLKIGAPGSITITRQNNTTPYDAGDAIGDGSTAIFEFTGLGDNNGQVLINKSLLKINIASAASLTVGFTLHLFKSSPTAIADAATFALQTADIAAYQGSLDIALPIDKGAVIVSENKDYSNEQCTLSSTGSLFGILTTIGAWTPPAGLEQITIDLKGMKV